MVLWVRHRVFPLPAALEAVSLLNICVAFLYAILVMHLRKPSRVRARDYHATALIN